MAGRNRNLYTDNGISRTFRTLLVMCLVGAFFFGLGFFIISPVLHRSSTGNADSSSQNSKSLDGKSTASIAAPHPDAPAPPTPPAIRVQPPSSIASPSVGNPQGRPQDSVLPPSIEPAAQPPRSTVNSRPEAPAVNGGAVAGTGVHRLHSEAEVSRRDEPGIQHPDTPDRVLDEPAASGLPNETTPGTRTGASSEPQLYRVQMGVFSTPDVAEQEAQKARGKGVTVRVQQYTDAGRTLYRVQHGLYRNRVNAQKALNRVTSAGVSAQLVAVKP